MMHNSTLADQQSQRLFRSGLATHVVDPAETGLDPCEVLAALQSIGGDCICVLADGRVAFSSVSGLPEKLRQGTEAIIADQSEKMTDDASNVHFHSRRNPEFAANLMNQMAASLNQISKSQALVSRLTHRLHVMEIALSRVLSAPADSADHVTGMQTTELEVSLAALFDRFDDMNARMDKISAAIARNDAAASQDPGTAIIPILDTFAARIERALTRPAPAVDMTPIHTAMARQATATSQVLARLERITEIYAAPNTQALPAEVVTDRRAAITAINQPASATASDEMAAQLAQLTDQVRQTQSTIAALPAAMAQPTLQRESFARYGVALQTVIDRVEQLAERIGTKSDHAAIHKVLSDINARIGSGESSAHPALAELRTRVDSIAVTLADTKLAIATLPVALAAPVLQRESFARFGVALKTAIHRIEDVADQLLNLAEQSQIQSGKAAVHKDSIDEFLEDMRFATAEMLAVSLKDRAQAS